MSKNIKINILEFLKTVDSKRNPDFVTHLSEALKWLDKRQDYSHHYYRQLKASTTSAKLEKSLFMFNSPTRIRFEAANLAYLQNLHAACDAFPFALHVLLGGISGAQAQSGNEHFKWNKELQNRVKEKFPREITLHGALDDFSNDKNFLVLAALVNQAKHKYLPGIRCNLNTVTSTYSLVFDKFEYFSYSSGKRTSHFCDNLNVLDFAKTVHNDTLLRIFRLYSLAYGCISK